VQQHYPELLAQLEPSPQRFNGLTGDELYVEGVVKLPMLMGTTKILKCHPRFGGRNKKTAF
jgi:hypothetical protein